MSCWWRFIWIFLLKGNVNMKRMLTLTCAKTILIGILIICIQKINKPLFCDFKFYVTSKSSFLNSQNAILFNFIRVCLTIHHVPKIHIKLNSSIENFARIHFIRTRFICEENNSTIKINCFRKNWYFTHFTIKPKNFTLSNT